MRSGDQSSTFSRDRRRGEAGSAYIAVLVVLVVLTILALALSLAGSGPLGWTYREGRLSGAMVEALDDHLARIVAGVAADPDTAIGEVGAEREAGALEYAAAHAADSAEVFNF